MTKRLKKTPADYDLIAFRVSKEKRVELDKRAEKIVDRINKQRGPDERLCRKNEVLLKALERGLKTLEP
jgi:hypothetical protein